VNESLLYFEDGRNRVVFSDCWRIWNTQRLSQQQTKYSATPPTKQIFLPPRFWVVTWPAATRVFLPTTKGDREERPWERGWGITRVWILVRLSCRSVGVVTLLNAFLSLWPVLFPLHCLIISTWICFALSSMQRSYFRTLSSWFNLVCCMSLKFSKISFWNPVGIMMR